MRSARLIVLVLVLGSLAAACGTPSGANAAVGDARAIACMKVGAVLSNGPEPSADPIGYAEAQIRLLRRVKTSDAALRSAIARLDEAYAHFYDRSGAPGARHEIASSARAVDRICPGATVKDGI